MHAKAYIAIYIFDFYDTFTELALSMVALGWWPRVAYIYILYIHISCVGPEKIFN